MISSKHLKNFFEPITKFLIAQGYEFEDLWVDSDDSMEFKIEAENKLYSYDYTILQLKIIFEFNGHHMFIHLKNY